MIRPILFLTALAGIAAAAPIENAEDLVAAVQKGEPGAVIEIGEGTFVLSAPLEPKSGMILKGAGIGKTILVGAESWKPTTTSLPDPEMKTDGLDSKAYLIRVADKSKKVEIANLSLRGGARLHGAIFAFGPEDLHLHHLAIEDFLWSGVRTFAMRRARILDCQFVNAGGRWERGKPGVKGGITGGGIFAIWMKESEIAHNRFTRTYEGKEREYYGIKVRQGKQSRVHHNSIDTQSFSMEFPFENDEDVEIDHNYVTGPISIPKHAGGPVPESGRTFHIHHNYSSSGYAIEFVRNGIEIDHNLFDFDPQKDGGNLISGFGKAPAAGPALFHNNLVNNPGRGVIWINEPYGAFVIRNNHIRAKTTATPRKEGFFGFHAESEFAKMRIENNIIECEDLARPLFRSENSYEAKVTNNKLVNVADADRFTADAKAADSKPGLEAPLEFRCGVREEKTVKGWEISDTPKPAAN